MTSFRENASYLALMIGMILGAASPTYAVDGVLEINQACAVNTGCFPGDTAGFPVNIANSGSYRLTSNLTSNLAGAIASSSGPGPSDVTIDLNGFTLSGAGFSDGIRLYAGDNWEIRSGTIRGFEGGIRQAQISSGHRIIGVRVVDSTKWGISIGTGGAHLVEGCTVTGSGADGNQTAISVGEKSTVMGNTVANNFGIGMLLGSGTGYAGNVINNNGAGTVIGGIQIGTNVCDWNTTCP